MAGLDEYRGSKKWEGLIPAEQEPRVWDGGFRSFLTKYVHAADPVSNRRNQLFGQLLLMDEHPKSSVWRVPIH